MIKNETHVPSTMLSVAPMLRYSFILESAVQVCFAYALDWKSRATLSSRRLKWIQMTIMGALIAGQDKTTAATAGGFVTSTIVTTKTTKTVTG